ncbi:Ppx/GppA family phosphatase [Alicyclobacillus cycloheptanicus]|uniref:Exopolyphosphatase/guanosine-5'-triphosphate, 3'-diphosphate pyrophosphatase n=1 Tax=Alicyclobacillus cycloheptanicus TaxID=1457 RepID=A0ABT9XD30_9BACL|nr:Ppx/GppA family phosphatase [Alicyclobacillus cycloheptanicus]MDQ0188202.1 exopolyphosphatase/guanosine-5'-triphosphate,3'-diphosphate pyrophosphatase [Alicyclobacillus cycloheptanicus]WDM00933.1 Ppx/GppA family phosphatase [Alicyclobacillus cycloheptanicus]
MNRLGIIDLGSNSARLVIYVIGEQGQYRPSFRLKRNTRLAHYLDADKGLSEAGIDRAIRDVSAFRSAGQQFGIQQWIPVTTAAIRQAANRAEVLGRLQDHTGLTFRLLTGEEEAWYSYLGVINTMDIRDGLFVDIGGASTEVMQVQNRQLVHAVSIPFGALTLTRRFQQVPQAQQTQAITKFMKDTFADHAWIQGCSGLPIVGIGGTARAVAKIARQMHATEMNRYHGYEIDEATLAGIYGAIEKSSVQERQKLGKLSDTRAEMIHAGVAVIRALADSIAAPRFLVSGSGLREGLFYEHLFQTRETPVLNDVKQHSVHNMLTLFDVNPDLAAQVADCAVHLFDALCPLHHLGPSVRELLYYAAMTDMMGTYINAERYTTHTHYLLWSSHLYGFTQTELSTMTQIQTGKGPKTNRRLHLFIQLAKRLVWEGGWRAEHLHFLLTGKKLTISPASGGPLAIDLNGVAKGLHKRFGVTLQVP